MVQRRTTYGRPDQPLGRGREDSFQWRGEDRGYLGREDDEVARQRYQTAHPADEADENPLWFERRPYAPRDPHFAGEEDASSYGQLYGGAGTQGGFSGAPYGGGSQRGADWAAEPPRGSQFYAHPVHRPRPGVYARQDAPSDRPPYRGGRPGSAASLYGGYDYAGQAQREGDRTEPAEFAERYHYDPHYGRWRHEQLSNHDEQYHSWRDERARRYDEEYRRYSQQRYEEFRRGFDDWRERNQGASPGDAGRKADSQPGNTGVHATLSGVGSGSGGTVNAPPSGSPDFISERAYKEAMVSGVPDSPDGTASGGTTGGGTSTGSGSAGGTGSGSAGTTAGARKPK